MFMDWTKTKSELKFNPQPQTFPIIPNCIYWAFMGCTRINKPMRKSGSIISITEKDWKAIDYQIRREYLLTSLHKATIADKKS